MKQVAAALVLALGLNTQSPAGAIPDWLVPSPLTVALTVGQWITSSNGRVYQVRVQSQADDARSALRQGLDDAVKLAVGSLIINENLVVDGDLRQSATGNYSSGFVERFQEVSRQQTDDGIALVLDVWVRDSRVSDRFAPAQNKSGEFQGNQVAESYLSWRKQRQSGDNLVALVLEDFSKQAFQAQVTNTQIERDTNRLDLIVSVDFSWNPAYLDSLDEALARTSQKPSRDSVSEVRVLKKSQMFGSAYHFNDDSKAQMLDLVMFRNPAVVSIELKDEVDQVLHRQCYELPNSQTFYHRARYPVGGSWREYIQIDDSRRVRSNFRVHPHEKTRNWVKNVRETAKVQASLVPVQDCHKI